MDSEDATGHSCGIMLFEEKNSVSINHGTDFSFMDYTHPNSDSPDLSW